MNVKCFECERGFEREKGMKRIEKSCSDVGGLEGGRVYVGDQRFGVEGGMIWDYVCIGKRLQD